MVHVEAIFLTFYLHDCAKCFVQSIHDNSCPKFPDVNKRVKNAAIKWQNVKEKFLL